MERMATRMEKVQQSAVTIFWFRRDLRFYDNVGLYHALNNSTRVLPVFIFNPKEMQHFQQPHDRRMEFIYHTLSSMQRELQQKGKGLIVLHGNPVECIGQLVTQYTVQAVYANEEYEPSTRRRDAAVAQMLAEHNIPFVLHKDSVLRAKDELLSAAGTPYRVFTAYKNAWLQSLTENDTHEWQSHALLHRCMSLSNVCMPPLEKFGFQCGAIKTAFVYRLDDAFLHEYAAKRDFPALDATSHIGIHLRYGTVSIRRIVATALYSSVWLSELIWREFFIMILYHFPHVEHGAYKPTYDALPWRNSEEEFARWCEGRTGYPFVDAGMRQLLSTGWMHNRVRMVAASFLVKHLLIDWRWGEAHFASLLVDYDLAVNNGNWQWVAGTGCDAAPYFRIFHPHKQREKFDASGEYCRQWIPELGTPLYPMPMVEHSNARVRALQAYSAVLKSPEAYP